MKVDTPQTRESVFYLLQPYKQNSHAKKLFVIPAQIQDATITYMITNMAKGRKQNKKNEHGV